MRRMAAMWLVVTLLGLTACFSSSPPPVMKYFRLPVWIGVKSARTPSVPVVLQVEALDVLRGGPGWEGEPTVWCLGAEAWQRASEMGWRGRQRVERGDDHGELVARMASVARMAR